MSNNDFRTALEARWTAYERLRDQDAYAALSKLGEIDNCLQHGKIPQSCISEWQFRMHQIVTPPHMIDQARRGAIHHIDRLRRMLSTGGIYVYEEAMLVVTLRVELDMVACYLVKHQIDLSKELVIIDKSLLAIASESRNRGAFKSAVAMARKNWGLPLTSPLFGRVWISL